MINLFFKIERQICLFIFVLIAYALSVNCLIGAEITFIIDDSQFQDLTDCRLTGSWDVDGYFDPDFSSGELQMYDDGTNGDQIAGDHIWALQVNLVEDGGANTWEWSALDGPGGVRIVESVYEQFSLPDGSPQSLTYVREGYATPGIGVLWTPDSLVANSGGIVTGTAPEYVIQKSIIISATDQLSIPAGTTFRFDAGEFRVFGSLLVQGLSGNLVTFTSNQVAQNPDDWFAIHFKSGSVGSVNFAVVQYAHIGILCDHGGPAQVRNCLIENNGFAGLYLKGISTGTFNFNNISNCGQAGIYMSDVSYAYIYFNAVFNSVSKGFELYNSFPDIAYNIIYNNNHTGIDCSGSSPNIYRNTIDNNGLDPQPVGSVASGIECGESSSPTIKNNIITNNADHGINCIDASTPANTYNDVWGHTTSDYLGCEAGTGEISEDPWYINPSAGNYRLQSQSPCIDAGDPASALDPDGTRADMGAYYYYQIRHFNPVAPTGSTQPVFIVDAMLDGEQLQSGDEIGVFDGDLCVGAVKLIVLPLVNPITVYLEVTEGDTLPGAKAGNDMSFELWDRSEEREVDATISEIISGTPVFAAGATVSLSLESWSGQLIVIRPSFLNLISLNISPTNDSAAVVFDSLPNFIIAQDDNGYVRIPPDIVFPGHPGSNTIDENGGLQIVEGYEVYISGDSVQNLYVAGSEIDLSTTTIPLAPSKLNKISFPSTQFMLIQNVFSESANEHIYNDLSIVQDHDGYVYIPPNIVFPGHPGSNTIDDNGGLQPGKGYMLYHRNASELSFTYPTAGGGSASLAKATPGTAKAMTEHFNYTKTGLAHAVFFKNQNVALEAGDELGVFAGDMCVGGMKYQGDLKDPLMIWCALPDYGLTGVEEGDRLTVKLWKSGGDAEEVLDVEGDVDYNRKRVISVIEISSASVSGEVQLISSTIPKKMGLGQNYPNPFNPVTRIEFSLNRASDVNLMVYNITGELVRILVSETYLAGKYQIEWDGRNENGQKVASGIYIYRMVAGSYHQTRKMIFTK